MTKSSVAINKIRTGLGDNGDTKLGGKTYRKGHPVVLLSSYLDIAQAYTFCMPEKWGDFRPRELIQELLFRIGAAVGGRRPKDQEVAVTEIAQFMEGQIDFISSGLEPLDSFIRSGSINYEMHQLRAFIRQAECQVIVARDYIELNEREVSASLLYALNFISKALNIASDWIFTFIWLYSADEKGKLYKYLKWVPMDEEKIRVLNV